MYNFKDKNILVTGGTGFLGTNFVNSLTLMGANVILHGLSKKDIDYTIPHAFEDLSHSCNLFIDISNHYDYTIDCVFHCAAFTGGATVIKENPDAITTINNFINMRTIEAAAKSGVKKFIFISSTAVYPETDLPVTEDMGFVGDPEKTFFGPGWMKRYGEKLAEFFYKRYGMQVLIIRPSNVYGPHSSFDPSHSHVIPALIRRFVLGENPLVVWGIPDVIRDFIYIDDFVRGTILAMDNMSGFDVYNIATGIQTTIGETVEHIKNITKYNGNVQFDSSKPITKLKQIVSIDLAKRKLNFSPEIDMYSGLKLTIDWYKKNKKDL